MYFMLWRCHIAPAKPNGPIPFDLNDKRWNLPGQIVFFFICHRAHTDLYRVHTGSCPAWYRTLRPHTVLACRSHRVLTVSSPCPHRVHTASSEICNAVLKYVMVLWNMYCCSEICIATLKYVLLHQNIYFHSEICYPDGMHTFANHLYTVWYGHRPTNGSIYIGLVPAPHPLTILIPGSHRVPPLVSTRRKVLSLPKTFAGSHRVSPAANGPPTCSPIAQRPAVCPHRVPPFARNLPHGGTR